MRSTRFPGNSAPLPSLTLIEQDVLKMASLKSYDYIDNVRKIPERSAADDGEDTPWMLENDYMTAPVRESVNSSFVLSAKFKQASWRAGFKGKPRSENLKFDSETFALGFNV